MGTGKGVSLATTSPSLVELAHGVWYLGFYQVLGVNGISCNPFLVADRLFGKAISSS